MADPNIHIYDSLEALSDAAAQATVARFTAAPTDQPFALVLSGGSTPKTYHRLLATTYRDAIDWSRVHLFWGDERYVPHADPASNYRMAKETLIDHVPIPTENTHPVPTHFDNPQDAANAYAATLHTFFGTRTPALDLVLLGLGDDGHTASLFPGTDALNEKTAWVTALEAPPYAQPRTRITLTYPLLNQSQATFFMAAGAKKQIVLDDILTNPTCTHPAAAITSSSLHWYVDEAARATNT